MVVPALSMAVSRFTLFLVVICLLQPLTFAQTSVLSSTLPSCAQQCPVLMQAQSACVPPPLGAAAVSNQQTYTSCFCQSSYLGAMKSGSAGSLCPQCSAADMSTTQQWYNGLCQQGNAPTNNQPNGQQPAASPSSTLITSTTQPASKQTGSSRAGGVTQDTSPADQDKSWISTHYRWVIMLIILFFGLLALGLGFRWWYHRHQRRQELGGHDRSGQPDLVSWGPGQSVHEFGPPGAAGAAVQTEKGKEKVTTEEQPHENKRSSRRLGRLKRG